MCSTRKNKHIGIVCNNEAPNGKICNEMQPLKERTEERTNDRKENPGGSQIGGAGHGSAMEPMRVYENESTQTSDESDESEVVLAVKA